MKENILLFPVNLPIIIFEVWVSPRKQAVLLKGIREFLHSFLFFFSLSVAG